jgi:hypothetical protein
VADDFFTGALQENLVTLLCFDDEHGKVVANMLDTELMDGDYREVAEKAVDYWRQYSEAPKDHTADLFSDILEDPHNRRATAFKRILSSMTQLAETVNTKYVIEQLRQFTRMQRFKAAVISSAEKLSSKQQMAIAEVEELWQDLLHSREVAFDPGITLLDVDRVLAFLQQQFLEFDTGIPVLDQRGVVPYRSGVMLILAPPGYGKSWCLSHMGRRAHLRRKKILHISLEMPMELVVSRYYQSFFSIPRRHEDIEVTRFDMDDGRLTGLIRDEVYPDFYYRTESGEFNDVVRDELFTRLEHFGTRFANIIVKSFPPRSLTVNGLRAFLDNLEVTQRFIPDMLILDYIGIMRTDQRDHRISLGRVMEDFRGLCVERNIAGVTAQQVSRAGSEAGMVTRTGVAEDWSLIGTADQVITYSCTNAEERLGLARLWIDKSRSEKDRFGVLITQAYKIGQFCLSSMLLPDNYYDVLKDNEEGEDEDDDNDEKGKGKRDRGFSDDED